MPTSQAVVSTRVRLRRRPLTRRTFELQWAVWRFSQLVVRQGVLELPCGFWRFAGVERRNCNRRCWLGVSVHGSVGSIVKELAPSLGTNTHLCIPSAAADFKPKNWPPARHPPSFSPARYSRAGGNLANGHSRAGGNPVPRFSVGSVEFRPRGNDVPGQRRSRSSCRQRPRRFCGGVE